MATPAVMSEKALAKFRTKLCERLLATNTCSFADRCQYSHDTSWRRRNPEKYAYSHKRCVKECCSRGLDCPFAHSADEELYHPDVYKTRMCADERACGGFYCSFAHAARELRNSSGGVTKGGCPGRCEERAGCRLRGGRRGRSGVAVASVSTEHKRQDKAGQPKNLDDSDAGAGRWWCPEGCSGFFVSTDQILDTAGVGASLLGGSFRVGFFSKGSTELPCRMKLMAISRRDSQTASDVIRDTRRWQSCPVLAIRRTVATVFAALTVHSSSLGKSVSVGQLRLAEQAATDWPVVAIAARWARQLADAVATLHSCEITHLCIGPATIEVTKEGELVLGDFVGKITLSQAVEEGWKGVAQQEQAMWYPPEVKQASLRSWPSIDEYAVDTWQLGISLFYMMTGSHLYGDLENPKSLCTGITLGERCNIGLLQHLPLFADLITRMSDFSAWRRPTVRSIRRHPMLWSLEETLEFAVPCAAATADTGVDDKAWICRRTSEALAHIPYLAPMAAVPPPYEGGWAPELCEEALQGEHDPRTFVQRLAEQKVEDMAGQQPHSQPSTPTHVFTESTTEGGATPGSPLSTAATAGQQPFRCGQDPVPPETVAEDQGAATCPTLVTWASFHTLGLEPAFGHGVAVSAMPKWIASTRDSLPSPPPPQHEAPSPSHPSCAKATDAIEAMTGPCASRCALTPTTPLPWWLPSSCPGAWAAGLPPQGPGRDQGAHCSEWVAPALQPEGPITAEPPLALPRDWQSWVPFCEDSSHRLPSGGGGASFLSTAPCFSRHPALADLGCSMDVSDALGFSWPPPPPPLPPMLGYFLDPEAQCIPADLFSELNGDAAQ